MGEERRGGVGKEYIGEERRKEGREGREGMRIEIQGREKRRTEGKWHMGRTK